MKKLILIFTILMSTTVFPMSEKLAKAISLWYQGKNEEALTKYLEIEKTGDPEVYYYLAQYYQYAPEDIRDIKKSIEYLEKGTQLGQSDCMLKLGKSYEKGEGIEKNPKKAEELYKAVIDKKDYHEELGYFYLGYLYYKYAQTKEDYREVVELFDKSENPEGYYYNAVIYSDHLKEERQKYINRDLAIEYLGKSANRFYRPAMMILGMLWERAKKYEEAFERYEMCLGTTLFSNELELEAYYKVGYFYKEGLGVEKDYTKALENFLVVIREEPKQKNMNKINYSNANYQLGLMYENGLGVDIDSEKAKTYFEEAEKYKVE